MTAQPIRLDEAEHYLGRVVAALHALTPERKGPLVGVLNFLLEHIRRTRTEFNALKSNAAYGPSLSSAVDELEEIVLETAAATNKIMDAAEVIERIAGNAPGGLGSELRAEATKIYEASAFQDITGQRITKAIRAFQAIEQQITTLVKACCDGSADALCAAVPHGDNALMNGPQRSGLANSQADIDKLLESLG